MIIDGDSIRFDSFHPAFRTKATTDRVSHRVAMEFQVK
jgi:hypothetical protein